MTVAELVDERAASAPNTYPIPQGRGRWRLTLHARPFSSTDTWQKQLLVELTGARGRRLEQKWNTPATLTFTLDGHDPSAALIQELAHEVIAWRWDDTTGADRPMFRGVIGQSEDELTVDKHVTTFTCHDYAAMMGRRFLTSAQNVVQQDQDDLASNMVRFANDLAQASNGTFFTPGSFIPLTASNANPDGSWRPAKSGQLRDRSYAAQSALLDLLTNLAQVQNGFDFAVAPLAMNDGTDMLQIFYPQQGVTRTAPSLAYGSTVSTVTRAVNSDSYANYIRVLGSNASGPAPYAETWSPDALGRVVGLWPFGDNASDVSIQSTLNQRAAGALVYYGTLLPTYTLGLTPGTFYAGAFGMGDTVPLMIYSGRLKVNTPVRIVGLAFVMNDDTGDEDVIVTVGRPTKRLTDIFSATQRDVDALARR